MRAFTSDLKGIKNSKSEGNDMGILRRSFFPFYALGMPSFNNSVLNDISDIQSILIFE